jgi:superfamily II DNA or RNA helicase
MISPRDYQLSIHADIEAGWDDATRQLVVEPTGMGKTIQFAMQAAAGLKRGDKTLILAHRDELIDQAIDKIERVTGVRADKEKAGSFASLDSPIVVGSIQTLVKQKRLERWPQDHFGEVVVDETHRALAKSYQIVLKHFDEHANILGVTATPRRSDKRNLGEYFQRTAAELKLLDAISAGWLVPIVFSRLPIAIDLGKVKATRTDYGTDISRQSAADAITPYLDKMAEAVRERAGFRRCLGFAPLVETSRKAAEACRAAGLVAEYIHGDDPDRARKLQKFQRGEYDILWNADLLTEGYDDPGIGCIVNFSPTQSVSKYWQINGRGTRCTAAVDDYATPELRRAAIAASNKPNLLILDFLYHNHPVCTPANLIAGSDEEAQQIMECATSGKMHCEQELDLMVEGKKAELAREETLRKKLEQNKKRQAETMSAEEFALTRGDFGLATYEPTMRWESAAVSEGQAKYLKRAKIDVTTVKGFGHASKLLDVIFHSSKPKLASPNVVNLMRRMRQVSASVGITDFENVTTAQQAKFFSELNQRKKARKAA